MSGVLVNGDAVENDPAAEFLAREQDELAGLGEELPDVRGMKIDVDENEDAALDADMREAPIEEPNNLKQAEIRTPTASPIPTGNSNREEPEKIRKWREEQKLRLQQKDEDEEVQKGKLREQAKRELEEWYKAHEEQISKTKACNRENAIAAEKEYQAMSEELVPGQEWERIAKLCEFNPKLTRTTKDTSRMRSIILQLKQNPPNKTANSVAS